MPQWELVQGQALARPSLGCASLSAPKSSLRSASPAAVRPPLEVESQAGPSCALELESALEGWAAGDLGPVEVQGSSGVASVAWLLEAVLAGGHASLVWQALALGLVPLLGALGSLGSRAAVRRPLPVD